MFLWRNISLSGKYPFPKHMSLRLDLDHKVSSRSIKLDSALNGKIHSQIKYENNTEKESASELVEYLRDKRILYSSYIVSHKILHTYGNRRKIEEKIKAREKQKLKVQSVPLILERLMSKGENQKCETPQNDSQSNSPVVSFPYSHTENIDLKNPVYSRVRYPDLKRENTTITENIAYRMHAYEKGLLSEDKRVTVEYDLQDKCGIREKSHSGDKDYISNNLGTADINIPVSGVPCGGCGAHLHCQEPALPGFIPKELFVGLDQGELRSHVCQRCYFLKHRKMALSIRISPDVYPNILKSIQEEKALAIVVVDLLDVPCSIWPEIMDIIDVHPFLQFPILRPSGLRLQQRVQRLKEIQKKEHLEKKIRPKYTNDISIATLSGHIGRTFEEEREQDESSDPFSIRANIIQNSPKKILGIDTAHPRYALGKWCYDTPGTVQPDQIINLLTHDELLKVLPKKLIRPRSFSVTSGKSLFLGGLARLDIIYGPESVRLTVFASEHIPINIVETVEASAFYRQYLGSTLLGIPIGNEERLLHWPILKPKDMRSLGTGQRQSCADIVLSSAGWIAVTGYRNHVIELRGWTPGGRGIHLREPSMLPLAVNLKGDRIGKSPAYKPHKLYVSK
ncbi:nitric oxide-associated protein 1-like [Penaeus indicus]|uniref:nitric oxide-associated protein 1-like n=1 Tax=Penaeus indicus TaxID=29960 RepID=UPI00300C0C32